MFKMAYVYFMRFIQLLKFRANIEGNCTFFFNFLHIKSVKQMMLICTKSNATSYYDVGRL